MSRPRRKTWHWLLATSATLLLLWHATVAFAGEWPQELCACRGTTPTLDGVISPGEWDDATSFAGVKGWTPQFTPTTDPEDLSVKGYVKYDDKRLYFAFDVTDDVLYGLDTERWLSDENPKAHQLTREGFPWFGDEIELLINAANRWQGNENAAGNGTSWQMVCNLTKSRLGGIGVGGLLEGEPRSKKRGVGDVPEVDPYHTPMDAVARVKPGRKGYVIEWAVSFDPCLEVAAGQFFKPGDKEVRMGLNIAIGDLDEKGKGMETSGIFITEDWFAGEKNTRTQLRQWGTLRMMPGARSPASR